MLFYALIGARVNGKTIIDALNNGLNDQEQNTIELDLTLNPEGTQKVTLVVKNWEWKPCQKG